MTLTMVSGARARRIEAPPMTTERLHLADARLLDFEARVAGEILHVLAEPPAALVVGAPASGRVDAARRRDHVQRHRGQHSPRGAGEWIGERGPLTGA